jgi:hypothetical protein
MEANFLEELDRAVSEIGTDKVWKKEVGGRTLWLSPLSYKHQLAVQETLTSPDLGDNAIQEAKRITLSYSVVGIDSIDFRPYRDLSVFPGTSNGKAIKVPLQKYLGEKIRGWGHEVVDLAFDVFADCMESLKAEIQKDVKFENAKDPYQELAELEERVRVLRSELGLPQAFAGTGEDKEPMPSDEDASAPAPAPEPERPVAAAAPFDPFAPVPRPRAPAPDPVQLKSAEALLEEIGSRPAPPDGPPTSIPIPVPGSRAETAAARAAKIAAMEAEAELGSIDRPHRALSSVEEATLDVPAASRAPVAPPPIDNVKSQSRNPRFAPPSR